MSLRDDRGDTLIEILLSLIILGIAGIAIMTALEEGAFGSSVHRDRATAESAIRYFAEDVVSSQSYDQCILSPAHSASYSVALPSGGTYGQFTGQIVLVEYWNDTTTPASFTASCPSDGDRGVQRITLKVDSQDNRQSTSVLVMKRNPGYAP